MGKELSTDSKAVVEKNITPMPMTHLPKPCLNSIDRNLLVKAFESTHQACLDQIPLAIEKLKKKSFNKNSYPGRRYYWERLQDLFLLGRLYLEYKGDDQSIFKEVFDGICSQIGTEVDYKEYIPEFSQLLIDMGRLYLDEECGNKECLQKHQGFTRECFEKAIALIEGEYTGDTKYNMLWAFLAKSYIKDAGKAGASLVQARYAQNLNSVERENAKVLGEVFFDLQDYDNAVKHFGLALSRNPTNSDNPNVLIKMGESKLYQAMSDHQRIRKSHLREALSYCDQALNIYEGYDLKKRGVARYYIGRIYMELGEYDKAIPNLATVYNAHVTSKDPKWLIAGYHLGLAYLKNKIYDESYRVFGNIISFLLKPSSDVLPFLSYDEIEVQLMRFNNIWVSLIDNFTEINKVVSIGMNEKISLGRILTIALGGIALSFAIRGDNPKEAANYIEMTDGIVNMLENKREILECKANNLYCKALIFYKSSLIYNQCDINRAIELFKGSISIHATSEAYLYLALAYKFKMDGEGNDKDVSSLKASIRACCRQASDLDLKGEFSNKINELEQSLEATKQEDKSEDERNSVRIEAKGTLSWTKPPEKDPTQNQ